MQKNFYYYYFTDVTNSIKKHYPIRPDYRVKKEYYLIIYNEA